MAPRQLHKQIGLTCFVIALLIACPASVRAWGGATHRYIAQNYSKHLPATMSGLRAYDSVVDAHVNDPDIRRPTTPGEEFRHYIDVDYYWEFLAGAMPHDRATLEATHGPQTVLDTGIVPWAVGEVVTTLTQQLQAGQWSAAALTIADLCHYVGDVTQPLHCTMNFNGQLSGNGGIHSRYETTMMNSHIADLSTPVMPVAYYANSADAMFGLVSGSWDEVDAVLAADNTAKAASGGAFNSTYYASLWTNTASFTRTRIDSATVATASFVHTAWVNAGRPFIPGSTAGVIPTSPVIALSAGPTPFRDALTIQFAGNGPMTVDVFDVRGTRIERLVDGASTAGTVTWRPEGRVAAGLYFVRLAGPGLDVVRRVSRLR